MTFEIKHTVAPAEAIEQMNQIMDKVLQELPVDNHDLLMAHVPTLDEIPESTEDQMPAETCTCEHRDLFQYHDEHASGVGCERRHCPCTWWPTDGEEF